MQLFKSIVLLIMDTTTMKFVYSQVLKHLFRDKKIYFVTGMRRSGNHAFIQWLVNSVEGKQSKLTRDKKFKNFNTTPSKSTIFLNEVNEINTLIYLRMIFNNTTTIRNCSTLVISVEDCNSNYSSYKIPRYDVAIYVKRSVLNLIASRVKYLVKRAKRGKASYWSALTKDILDKILSFHSTEDYITWEYEKWLTSHDYQQAFLKTLGLQYSYIPEISRWGGGSSFSGVSERPNPNNLTQRYLQIRFSEEIISCFQADQYMKLLSSKEQEFLKNTSY